MGNEGENQGGNQGGQGGEGNQFLATIKDEGVRNHPSLANFKDPDSLAKSWVEAQGLIGAPKLIDPTKAKPEDWDKTFTALGRPDSPDKYEIPEWKHDVIKENPEFRKAFAAKAHQLGFLPGQVRELYGWYNQQVAADYEAITAQQKEGNVKLKGEWKGAEYDANLALAKKVIGAFAEKDEVALFERNLENDPVSAKFLLKVAKAMSEDKLVGGGGGGAPSGAVAAKAKIKEIMADEKHAYWNGDSPVHKDAVAEMTRLHQLAYGE